MSTYGMPSYEIDPRGVRELEPDVLDARGRMKVLPASFWAETTYEERALFGHRQGIYSFPTVELVEELSALIAGRRAIEIGAGHGVLAEALGIPATDSKQQNRAKYRAIYELTGQPPVKYGRNVTQLDARAAVRRYRPEVVIGCWVTHKYDPRRHWASGNEAGIDEADVIANTGLYVVIGNERVHASKAIWDLPHRVTHAAFLYSRAAPGSREFLAMWPNSARPAAEQPVLPQDA